MKIKELGLCNSDKVQIFCDVIVSSTIGSTCPKAGLWCAFGEVSYVIAQDKYNLLSKAEVKRVTDYCYHKCIELTIPVDEEFYESFINGE